MLDRVPRPCQFQGCEVEAFLTDLLKHESECERRLIRCPDAHCQKEIALHDLPAHLDSTVKGRSTHFAFERWEESSFEVRNLYL